MPTSLLNSKKCLTAKYLFAFCFIFLSPLARAAIPESISSAILNDIHHRKSNQFDSLLSSWEKRYGTQAVTPLLSLARNSRLEDPDRYVAIMGVAKIGGTESAPLLVSLLKDKSWMIRNGTIRALAALKNPKVSSSVLPLLNDRALVVRLEAVQALEKLRPEGVTKALLAAIQNPENYHGGRAQWIPQQALETLRHLRVQNSLTAADRRLVESELKALLDHPSKSLKDPTLRPQIEATLRALD